MKTPFLQNKAILSCLALACFNSLVPLAQAQQIAYTTTGTMVVKSGPDSHNLAGSVLTVTNTLTAGQTPVAGTQNQFSTTITVSDTKIPFGITPSGPAVVTINYAGANSANNNLSIAGSISAAGLEINVASTFYIPSIPGVSPGPIASTSLDNPNDLITLSDSTSQTSYTLSNGTISSSPGLNQCTFGVTPSALAFPLTGGMATLTVEASSQSCAWTAAADQQFIHLSATSGTGNGTVTVTVADNTGGVSLSGNILIAGQTVPVTEPGAAQCTYAVSPLELSFPSGTSSLSVTVTPSAASCPWSAALNQTWVTLSSTSGAGTGTVQLNATPNTTPMARSATLTVAGQQFPLIQAGTSGGCSFAVAPGALDFVMNPGTQYFYVAATLPACAWNVSLSPTWTVATPTTGTGSGAVALVALANTTGASRSGTVVLAGISLSVLQLGPAGCTYTVSPASVGFPSGGGAQTVNVTAIAPSCTWTAASDQPWTTLSAGSGMGNGSVIVTGAPNPTTSFRYGSLTVGGQTVNVNQAGLSGCYFSVSPTSVNFPGAGGTTTLTLNASAPTCPWSVSTLPGWITMSATSGTGSATLALNGIVNTTTAPLTAALSVAGQNVTVNEAAGQNCAFTVSPDAVRLPASGGSAVKTIVASASVCAWAASASAPWITLSATSGTGSGSVTISGADNTLGFALSGSVTLAGQTFPVSEGGGCSYTVTPTSLILDGNAASPMLTITASPSSCQWTASSNVSWATPGSATGSAGTLPVSFTQNTTGVPRSGVLTVAGQSVSLFQADSVQRFTDVPPNAYYFDAVNAFAAKGITTGCGPTVYCPTATMTREQMAVFLVRSAYGGDGFTSSPTPYFNDVPVGAPGFAWIQKFFELGLTTGCGNGNFCPTLAVTRDQLAVFLTRARYVPTDTFVYSSAPVFADVPPTYWAFAWIQRLAEDAITNGCAVSLFCPGSPVTRGDAAILIMRGMFNQFLPAVQPYISSISPAVLTHGTSQTFMITGVNTNFADGTTTISPIPGVSIGIVAVSSPTQLTVTLTAAENAPIQPQSIVVTTANQEAVLPNGLRVE